MPSGAFSGCLEAVLASIFMQFVLGKFLGRAGIFAADSSDSQYLVESA